MVDTVNYFASADLKYRRDPECDAYSRHKYVLAEFSTAVCEGLAIAIVTVDVAVAAGAHEGNSFSLGVEEKTRDENEMITDEEYEDGVVMRRESINTDCFIQRFQS